MQYDFTKGLNDTLLNFLMGIKLSDLRTAVDR